ncbi:hypothetical protein FMUAM8_54810 [Nocardia cyriacigeorgica]|nr:hypothetical protein FMUAM8_54810 [Nocardia cyriacigeorgica]
MDDQIGARRGFGDTGSGLEIAHVGARAGPPGQHADLVFGRTQPFDDQLSERTGAPGDQNRAHLVQLPSGPADFGCR